MTLTHGTVRTIGHYTSDEAARLVGVSPRRLSRWASYGIVPTIATNPNVYSYADVGEAILAHYLMNLGWQPGHIRALVHRLRDKWGPWPLATAPLENDGKLVVIREGDNLVFDVIDYIEHTVLQETLNLEQVRKALAHGGWVSLPELREYIQVDPDLHSGQPVVTGRRIPTAMIVEVADEPGGRDALRDDYGLTDEEINAAIEYEEAVATVLAA